MPERAIILAPQGRDGGLLETILQEARLAATSVPDLRALVTALDDAVGYVVVTEEALMTADVAPLLAWRERQPPWSDLPFILLTRGGGHERNPAARRYADLLGNVTFIERPFHPTTIVSLAESALRGRRKQYDARDRLEALHRSDERFRAAINAVQGVLWTNSADGRMDGTQVGWGALTGQSPDEYRDFGWASAVHPDDAQPTIDTWNDAVATRSLFAFEHRVRRHDGEWRNFSIRAVPIFATDGSLRQWVGVHTDITSRRQAEAALRDLNAELEVRVEQRTTDLAATALALETEMTRRETVQAQLVQAQKMEALGQLVGGVAHDFNNILAAIQSAFMLLDRRVTDDHLRYIVGEGRKASDRATGLIKQMLAFARQEAVQPSVIDFTVVLAETRDMLCHAVGALVECAVTVAPDTWPVLIDRQQFEVALLNLAVNARDAMPSGGKFSIHARNLREADERPQSLGSGDHVLVTIADSGHGMDAATKARVFDPFFTTKAVGEGTGLGLAQVHGFAAGASGAVTIESVPGEGTTFAIYLPRSAIVDRAVASKPSPVIEQPRATLLLVDDDPQVRPVTAALLRDIGYTVVEAESAAVAVAMAELHPIDLLLTDVIMPEGDGPSLVKRLRARRPTLAAIYLTGFAGERPLNDAPVIMKPFSVEELGREISKALA